MTPAAFGGGDGNVWTEHKSLINIPLDDNFVVRPVINVTTDNWFTSGDGSTENPYVIN